MRRGIKKYQIEEKKIRNGRDTRKEKKRRIEMN